MNANQQRDDVGTEGAMPNGVSRAMAIPSPIPADSLQELLTQYRILAAVMEEYTHSLRNIVASLGVIRQSYDALDAALPRASQSSASGNLDFLFTNNIPTENLGGARTRPSQSIRRRSFHEVQM